jgi:NAD(P)-dependent dehydrogenase (short-subunit alcohol dehydrogenase family)
MGQLDGKIALVTGVGAGIGEAIALRYAEAGAVVVGADIDVDAGSATMTAARDVTPDSEFVECDMADLDQITALVDGVVERHGRLDVLVNNAGVTKQLGFFDVTPDDWDRINSVNTRGLFFCMQAAAARMREQDSGTIVNIASIAGKGYRGTSNIAYAGTKGCVLALTRVGAHQLARYGITVNSLCPGVTRTTLFNQVTSEAAERTGRPLEDIIARAEKEIPIRRSNSPDDIAHAAVFLGSDAARNITGQSLNVDGGLIFD